MRLSHRRDQDVLGQSRSDGSFVHLGRVKEGFQDKIMHLSSLVGMFFLVWSFVFGISVWWFLSSSFCLFVFKKVVLQYFFGFGDVPKLSQGGGQPPPRASTPRCFNASGEQREKWRWLGFSGRSFIELMCWKVVLKSLLLSFVCEGFLLLQGLLVVFKSLLLG